MEITTPIKNEEYELFSGASVICTGKTVEIENRTYHEFVERTPALDWFRFHYLSEQGMSSRMYKCKRRIKSEDSFTDVRFMPQVIDNLIKKLMIEQLERLPKN